MSFTRRPGSGRPRQTSRREDHHIVRNVRVQPTASSAAIQVQVAPSLGAPVSSRTIRRRLAEGHLGSRRLTEGHLRSRRPLRVLPLPPTHRHLRLEWFCARGNWTAAEWNQVVFSDESRFNLSSDDNRVRVWRPRGERPNPAFALQRDTVPTAGVMVWGAIAYFTRSPLVLIRGNMIAQRYVHDILQPCTHAMAPRSHFSTRECSATHYKGVTRLSPHCYYPSMACPIPRCVSNRAYLGSFRTLSWVSHEFERTRDKVRANMERNISRHHTELVFLNGSSYRIMHSR
ncbi:transposable element Tcb1 transposase [Trichonephila clavipes]|nr:transposable element Tcb1 transposase [Trichonephila clavipes]